MLEFVQPQNREEFFDSYRKATVYSEMNGREWSQNYEKGGDYSFLVDLILGSLAEPPSSEEFVASRKVMEKAANDLDMLEIGLINIVPDLQKMWSSSQEIVLAEPNEAISE